jgi:hypothetical protein
MSDWDLPRCGIVGTHPEEKGNKKWHNIYIYTYTGTYIHIYVYDTYIYIYIYIS